jgi:hypothetical protein
MGETVMPTKEYRVRQGDCISSIAYEHGFFPDTLWNHSENAELKQNRKDMNLLEVGDIVRIPEKEEKEESAAPEQKHRFRKKGVPAKLRMKIFREQPLDEQTQSTQQPDPDQEDTDFEEPEEVTGFEQEPWADCPFRLIIDGKTIEGNTDGDGFVDVPIPPNAQQGKLIMNPGEPDEKTIPLQLGTLGAAGEIAGLKRRLSNLGYNCGDQSNEITDDFREVLKMFQEAYELEISGEPDDATKNKISELTES